MRLATAATVRPLASMGSTASGLPLTPPLWVQEGDHALCDVTWKPVGGGSGAKGGRNEDALIEVGPETNPALHQALLGMSPGETRQASYQPEAPEGEGGAEAGKPRAIEYPKSPSPTTASRSPKYFSLSTAVCAIVRTTSSTPSKLESAIHTSSIAHPPEVPPAARHACSSPRAR